MSRLSWFAGFLLVWMPNLSHAFPELVRHGYINCSACHYSVNGGGLLTPYGRALSKEVLSHGSFFFEKKPAPAEDSGGDENAPKEEDFLYGHVPLPSWAHAGGDLRFLQAYSNTPDAVDLRFIVMQLDLEGRAEYKRIALQATAGRRDPPPGSNKLTDSLVSHRHWISLQAGPEGHADRVQLRVGRFYPAYGLYIPDHNVVTRSALGFDANQETYNAELSWIDEKLNVHATGIFGRPDAAALKRPRGGALQVAVPVGDTYKIGVSALSEIAEGAPSSSRLNFVGAYGILGFTPHHFALLEVDGIHSPAKNWGTAEYAKLGWEFDQGAIAFFSGEFGRSTFSEPNQRYESYVVGLQYFPRPHWEFLAAYGKQRTYSVSHSFSDVAWILLHYYL